MKERIRTALHNTANRIHEPLRDVLVEALAHIEHLEREVTQLKQRHLLRDEQAAQRAGLVWPK